MDEISVIGIDLAKRVFQLCALSASGEVVWNKRLGRTALMRFMADRAPRCLIGLEACGGAHYWGRWLSGLGFRVKMMSPQAVKPYVTGGHKNDPRDARAIAEAATRSHVSAVRIKSQQAQALQALVRVRERQVRQRVQVVHQLRALLHEFGFIAPKGYGHLLRVYRQLAGSGGLAGLRRRCHGTVCSPP
ncbi:MAG: IS110 family transposase [Proteobacteria bacterium]|nr:IS110 family transposase [Pseudomonadota bacterium]